MNVDNIYNTIFDLTKGNIWIAKIFGIIFISLVIDLLQKKILARIQRKLAKTHNIWDDAIASAIKLPLTLVIWMVGLSFALELTELPFASTIRESAVVIGITWFVIRLVKFVEANVLEKSAETDSRVDRTTADAIAQLLRASAFVTGSLVLMQTLGFNISAVLAFGGIGGIAIGFAAKDLLSNFFGGMMIYLDRPFAVGDWIRSPDRNLEGHVMKIGWRLTELRTFDKRPLYIPNAIFSTIAVENPSRMKNRRINETIGVRYSDIDKIPTIVSQIKEMLLAHPDIDTDQTLIVNFNSFAASSLDIFVYTFTKTTNWVEFHKIKQNILIAISDIIANNDAEIAFPTTTVHLQQEDNNYA